MSDADAARIHTTRRQDLELLERTRGTALMRSVGEDWQVRSELGPGEREEELALVGFHLHGRADLAKCAPALRSCVRNQPIGHLIL